MICEDCSTDNTLAILKELEREDERIRVIRNEVNSGQALGRNRCFELARGEYIAIHDGDDYSKEDRLEKQAAFLDANPQYAFAASSIYTIDDEKTIRERPYTIVGAVKKEDFLFGLPFCHPSTMFRASALHAAGGYRVEKETRFRNEDYDMFMRMYGDGMKGYVLQERLYVYFEGRATVKRRKYRYRFAEAKVRYRNFKNLGLMPRGFAYAVKPLIIGLIPQRLLNMIRKVYFNRHQASKEIE